MSTSTPQKSIVLLSSGLDSTVNLIASMQNTHIEKVLTFDYGQKAAPKEIAHSKMICEKYSLPHEIIELSWLKNITNTSLVNPTRPIPKGESIDINSHEKSQETMKQVWVPNRNGVFLNIAAAYADAMEAEWVIPGFNIEEASTFPDNSTDYLLKLNSAFQFSTQNQVMVKCFTLEMTKAEIVRYGRKLKAPFELMWPCYEAQDTPCGLCESCLRWERAHQQA